MKRRQFLQTTGFASGSLIFSLGAHGWVAQRTLAQSNPRSPRLITIFLRGGIDGLSVAAPYRDPAYITARPNLALPQPGAPNGVLDLDGTFGLNPRLAPLLPLWKAKSLALVQACGLPNATRSHFDAQDELESGTPGDRAPNGWLNRLLTQLPSTGPTQAVNLGTTTPLILKGEATVASMTLGRHADRKRPLDRPQISQAFDQLYSGSDPLSLAYREAQAARGSLLATLEAEMMAADRGAPLPNGFAGEAQQLARLMRRDSRMQVAFLSIGGWDTHVNQGSINGAMPRRLQQLGEGLATLAENLGPVYSSTIIVVMSEFGRTVKENGNLGTDHGHGNTLMLLGGPIRGGKVYGEWRGLQTTQLHEGRDLPVTTDFRTVMASLVQSHFGLGTSAIAQIFPDFAFDRALPII